MKQNPLSNRVIFLSCLLGIVNAVYLSHFVETLNEGLFTLAIFILCGLSLALLNEQDRKYAKSELGEQDDN